MTCVCGGSCQCQEDNARLAKALELVVGADDQRREADRAREQAMLAARSALHLKIGEEAGDA